MCWQPNKVYNGALYYARQIYFKTKRLVGYAAICAEMTRTRNKHFVAMYVSSAQQTCQAVAEELLSFQANLKLFWQGKLNKKPNLPRYRKVGMCSVAYPKKWLKLQEGRVRVPLSNQVKAWFGIDAFWVQFPTNLPWETIRELRILPRHGIFYLEWVYERPPEPQPLDLARALAIDHGVNNWLTCVSNKVKSFNQWYNKQVARLKTGKPQGFWSQQLARITEKRNRRMRDAILHKAARFVVNYCLKHAIGRMIFGWNKGQKQECYLGNVNNQTFVLIPTSRLKERIKELCQHYGI